MFPFRMSRRYSTRGGGAQRRLDARFPHAVRGEDYSRYAAATWGQAVRWLRREPVRGVEHTPHDVYAVLHAAAQRHLERDLYPQEEQLISELVQREWDAIVAERLRASPEIPRFLRHAK